jgi:hypothetical protein
VCNVRQTEIHTAEPLVPYPSYLEVEIAIVQLENYKLPGSDQILAELIQTGGEALLSVVHKLVNSVWNKEELSGPWKESIVSIYKKGGKPDCNNFIEYPTFNVRSVLR